MAVGCPNPKTGKSERGGGQAHAHSIVGTNERAAGIYPDLLRGTWDKNRITWHLKKVKENKSVSIAKLFPFKIALESSGG